MESEVVFSYGRRDDVDVSEADLRDVMTHIEKLSGKCPTSSSSAPAAVAGSVVTHLQLSFVMKEMESLNELKSQLRNLFLTNSYRLVPCDKDNSLYYATTKPAKKKDDGLRQRTAAYAKYLIEPQSEPRSQSFSGFSSVLIEKRKKLLVKLGGYLSVEDMTACDGKTVKHVGGIDTELDDRRRRMSDARNCGEARTTANSSDAYIANRGNIFF